MKPINENSMKTRRKFDEAFKREAVQNWLSSGKSAAVIAEELGLAANRLYAWKQHFAPADAGGRPRSVADLETQLEAALCENRHLREQRDILKKTLGILSEPSPNATNGLTR